MNDYHNVESCLPSVHCSRGASVAMAARAKKDAFDAAALRSALSTPSTISSAGATDVSGDSRSADFVAAFETISDLARGRSRSEIEIGRAHV